MNVEKKYYGQNQDEVVINKYLNKDPNKELGTYVDIGACDPSFLSNTYYYYLKGWKGLEVDSYPGVKEKFEKERPRDSFLRAAVTNYDGEAIMYGRAIENSMVGDRYKKTYNEEFKIECLTMDTIMSRYPEFLEADFMSMDIETNEEKALSKCDFTIFKPRLICIEFPGEGHDHRKFWEHYLTPFYDFKEVLVNNAFYLRKEGV